MNKHATVGAITCKGACQQHIPRGEHIVRASPKSSSTLSRSHMGTNFFIRPHTHTQLSHAHAMTTSITSALFWRTRMRSIERDDNNPESAAQRNTTSRRHTQLFRFFIGHTIRLIVVIDDDAIVAVQNTRRPFPFTRPADRRE